MNSAWLRSLSDLGRVGCKMNWPVQISLRFPKGDRLLDGGIENQSFENK